MANISDDKSLDRIDEPHSLYVVERKSEYNPVKHLAGAILPQSE